MSTVPSKREAQHFLDTYADSFPQSFHKSVLHSRNKKGQKGKTNRLLNPNINENLGLVKIPSLLTDEELKQIGSTIVQLQHLGLMPIIFVDWPLDYKDTCEYRTKMINETLRISNIIEEMGGRSMPLYNNIFSTDEKNKKDVVFLEKNIFSHKKNIIDKTDFVNHILDVNMAPIRSALKLQQVPILIPIVSCQSQFFSTDFDRSMISFSKALTEDDCLGNPMKIIVLNNNGGICAGGYHYGFINLANDYEELLNNLDEEIKKWKAEIKSKNKLHNKFAKINRRLNDINDIKKGKYNRFHPKSSPLNTSSSLTSNQSTSSNSPYHLSKPSNINLFSRASPNSPVHSNFSTSLFPHSQVFIDPTSPKPIKKEKDNGLGGSTDSEMKNVLNIGLLRKYQMLYELQTMKIILSNLPINTSAIIASISSTPSIISNLITDKPICSDNLILQKHESELQPFLQYPPTLIRQGLKITRHTSLDTVDREKLLHLLNSSFKKPIDTDHYFKRLEQVLDSITITGDYQGASIITREGRHLCNKGEGVPYLDKFAVSPDSQGIGVADILWKRMKHDYPNMLWRSRAENPVNNWYFERSSGSIFVPTEHQDWRLFYYGEHGSHFIRNYCEIVKNIPASFKHK